MTAEQFLFKTNRFVDTQLNKLSSNNPLISLCKPIIKRVVDKNLLKAKNYLSYISDDKGNIDVEHIIPEMIESVMTTNPFIINVPVLGDILIGNGNIEMSIPYTDKKLIFNESDLQSFKQLIINE